jgi:hypothetical protein
MKSQIIGDFRQYLQVSESRRTRSGVRAGSPPLFLTSSLTTRFGDGCDGEVSVGLAEAIRALLAQGRCRSGPVVMRFVFS